MIFQTMIQRLRPFLLAAFVCATSALVCAEGAGSYLPAKFAGHARKSATAVGDAKLLSATPSNGLLASAEAGCFAPLSAEWGLAAVESAEYSGGGSVVLLRFRDASGAMAAFTQLRAQKSGAAAGPAVCLNVGRENRIAHVRDFVVIAAPSLSEKDLGVLMQSLPEVYGPSTQMPQVLQYLPAKGVDADSARYVLGPVGYKALGLPFAAEQINFDFSPEILVAPTVDRKQLLAIVSYPTPQMAIQRAKLFAALRQTPAQQASLHVKREGPMVLLLVGPADDATASSLFDQIRYEAQVTDNEKTHPSRMDNIGFIVIRACMLAGVVFLISVIPGILFGFRMEIFAWLFPRWAAKIREEKEFTGLRLR